MIKELREVMEYNGVTVNQLELGLVKEGEAISNVKFRKTIKDTLGEFSAISLELLSKFATRDGMVRVGEFCDTIRKYDVYQEVRDYQIDAQTL